MILLGLGGLFAWALLSKPAQASAAAPEPPKPEPPKPEPPKPEPPKPEPPKPEVVVVPASKRDPYGVANCMTKAVADVMQLRDVQRLLVEDKFLVATKADGSPSSDGICGPMTHKAIGDYQAAAGIPVTEYVDDATFKHMRSTHRCDFFEPVYWVYHPTNWGRPDLESPAGDVFVVIHAAITKFGRYEALVRVVKDASTGTMAAGSPCPYARVAEVIDLPNESKVPTLKLGSAVALRTYDLSQGVPAPKGAKYVEVPWPLTVP